MKLARSLAALAAVVGLHLATLGEAAAARLVASVSIANQTMTVSSGGRVLHRWKVSTGREGYRTPRGAWGAKRMHRIWYSKKYADSPMPYAIFYNGGFAVHGTYETKKLGRPASHGCVRLHPSNARRLYELTQGVGMRNLRVVVTR